MEVMEVIVGTFSNDLSLPIIQILPARNDVAPLRGSGRRYFGFTS